MAWLTVSIAAATLSARFSPPSQNEIRGSLLSTDRSFCSSRVAITISPTSRRTRKASTAHCKTVAPASSSSSLLRPPKRSERPAAGRMTANSIMLSGLALRSLRLLRLWRSPHASPIADLPEDHFSRRCLEHIGHRKFDFFADVAAAVLDHHHRPIFQKSDPLRRIL